MHAPAPDFRYVGLEPIESPRLGVLATACGLGAGVTLAMSSLDTRQAFVAGAIASVLSAFALKDSGSRSRPRQRSSSVASGSARMAIVPWGVLVDVDDTPRILRWAAVRTVDVQMSRARRLLFGPTLSSRVEIATEHDTFVGEAVGVVPLERLVEHVSAYATEQGTPTALDLVGELERREGARVEVIEPGGEMLIESARDWLRTAEASARLGLEPAGYRRTSSVAATPRAVDVLRKVLGDRTPKSADPRAFAAVLAAELHAVSLVPELVALAQCPHILVAGAARVAARKLGAPRSATGTLEELAPFFFEADRASFEAWSLTSMS